MAFSSSNLIRWCGLANLLAGVFTALYWFLHPGLDSPEAALGKRWIMANTMFIVLLVLTLLGLVGLYARQSEKTGTLGFVGFLLSFISTALFVGAGTFDAYVVPVLTARARDLLDPAGPLLGGTLMPVFGLTGVCFAVGFVFFGIATFRAALLPRTAALLLIISAPILGFSPLMPLIARTIGSVVFGLANIWLGYALWSTRSS